MSTAGRSDPYLDFRFVVEIDSLVVGGFSEVTGLEAELQTKEYDEGGVTTHTHEFPTRFQHPNLQLRRGLTDATTLWSWLDAVRQGSVERKTGQIFLLDASGEAAWGWQFRDALPVRWSGPDVSAQGSEVAIESLELTHRGLTRVDGLPS